MNEREASSGVFERPTAGTEARGNESRSRRATVGSWIG